MSNRASGEKLEKLVVSQICPIIPEYRKYKQQDAHEFLAKIFEAMGSKNILEDDPRKSFLIRSDKYHCALDIKVPIEQQILNEKGEYVIKDDTSIIYYILKSNDLQSKYVLNCISNEQYLLQSRTNESMLQLSVYQSEKTLISEKIRNLIFPQDLNNIEIIFKRPVNEKLNYVYLEKYNYIPGKYLLIHLKIFEYDAQGNVKKLSHQLGLTDDDDGTIKFSYIGKNDDITEHYELIGICYHLGPNLHSGHYIANIKHSSGWYTYDDIDSKNKYRSGPKETYKKEYLTDSNKPQPYILLYKQIS